nr:rhomboid-like protein 19 [Quercus suber]
MVVVLERCTVYVHRGRYTNEGAVGHNGSLHACGSPDCGKTSRNPKLQGQHFIRMSICGNEMQRQHRNLHVPVPAPLPFLINPNNNYTSPVARHAPSCSSTTHNPGASPVTSMPQHVERNFPWAVAYLVIVPLRSLNYPWTIATAALVENNIVSLGISTAVLWFGGRYLERAWGGKEFGIFCAAVIVLSNVWSCSVPTPIQGLVALEAAFLVALKQLVPEHTVSLFRGSVRCRIKHFPAIFVGANMLSGPLLGTDTALWLSLSGFVVAWTYLRFFRVSELSPSGLEAGEGSTAARIRGDASDTFSFVAFFPDFTHPVLVPICDGIYATLVHLKVCTPFSDEAIEAGNESVRASQSGLPSLLNGGGARRAEAERRRAIALKALDQRLTAAAAGRTDGALNDPVATPSVDPVSGNAGSRVEAAKDSQA